MSNSRRFIIWIMRALIAAVAMAAVALVLFPATPGLLDASWKYFRGRSGTCGLRGSLRSVKATSDQVTNGAKIADQMHIVQRDPAGYELWKTPAGQYWMPAGNQSALTEDLAEQSRDIYGGDRGVKPGDIVLDCGANIGLYTKKALVQGARLVVAIEPAPENLECLRRNLAQEISDKRVIVYPKGVWDKDDVLSMNIDGKNAAADSFVRQWDPSATHTLKLPLTTIDELVRELGLPRVDFVKMDIEGAEQKAIAGARQTIRKFRPRMAITLYHLRDDPVRIPQLVSAIDSRYEMDCDCLDYKETIEPQVGKFKAE